MLVDWTNLCIALAFGLIPPLRLLNCECRYLGFEDLWTRVLMRPSGGQRRRRWWKLPLVWIDPFRGYVVGYSVKYMFIYNQYTTTAMWIGYTFVSMVLLIVILAIQSKGRRREKECLSPGGFMAGLLLTNTFPVIGLGAIAVGLATAVAFRGYAAGYLAAALVTFAAGWQFVGLGPEIMATFAVVSAPAWLSWLKRKPMVTPVRC